MMSDEFSYLLGADTFVHGRLVNAPPSLSQFFESPHELVRPVYASKYPPGQAMLLALGQRLFGSPFYGVIIENAALIFFVSLMLFSWVSYWPALLTAAMVAACLQPGMYWADSYWGGSLAACGSAAMLLGIGMYRSKQPLLTGVMIAFGLLLLSWTRPFEGAVFAGAVFVIFGKELWRHRSPRVWFTTLCVLAAGGAWTGYYNRAITGSALELPYMLHYHQYNTTPQLWILPVRPEPVYSYPRLAVIHGAKGVEMGEYERDRHWPQGLGVILIESLKKIGGTLGAALLFTLLFPVAFRDPRYRQMAAVAGAVFFALTLETFHMQHYAAPAWGALAVMIAVWVERAWDLRIRGHRLGPGLVAIALIATPVSVAFRVRAIPSAPADWPNRRTALIQQLSQLDRDQLVVVRYPAPSWEIGEEWVYNGADIDRQRVVFAHDLGRSQNQALLDYYTNRTAWLLSFDENSAEEHLQPYPSLAR